MIIKSHIRGGFRSAAAYLKEQGANELTRLVEISDPHAMNLDQAFRAMWAITEGGRAKKPLHHVSINPMKDERLTDEQVLRICQRLEEKYGYQRGAHQRVIVEHIKEGRQHFHVMWNRVSLATGKAHWPYMHKMQSKVTAREMEIELGLKVVASRKQPKIGSDTKTKSILVDRLAWCDGIMGDPFTPHVAASRKRKGGKDGKGDGFGGGAASTTSVFKSSSKKEMTPVRPPSMGSSSKGYGGTNRRHKNIKVPVERREYKF
jgi:hypothetical protein